MLLPLRYDLVYFSLALRTWQFNMARLSFYTPEAVINSVIKGFVFNATHMNLYTYDRLYGVGVDVASRWSPPVHVGASESHWKVHSRCSIWPSGLRYYAVMQVTEKASPNHWFANWLPSQRPKHWTPKWQQLKPFNPIALCHPPTWPLIVLCTTQLFIGQISL